MEGETAPSQDPVPHFHGAEVVEAEKSAFPGLGRGGQPLEATQVPQAMRGYPPVRQRLGGELLAMLGMPQLPTAPPKTGLLRCSALTALTFSRSPPSRAAPVLCLACRAVAAFVRRHVKQGDGALQHLVLRNLRLDEHRSLLSGVVAHVEVFPLFSSD